MRCVLSQLSCFFLFFGISPVFLSINCVADEIRESSDQVRKVFGPINIGHGYATHNNQTLPSSAIPEFDIKTSEAEGSIQFELVKNKKSLEKELGIHASLEVPVKAVKVKNIVSFVNACKDSSNSISLLYRAGITRHYMMQPGKNGVSFSLSKGARSLYKTSKTTFLSTYGNAFITSARAGAVVYLLININFSMEEHKKKFEGSITLGKENIASAIASLKDFIRNNSADGSISIRAIQLGGDPARLSEIVHIEEHHDAHPEKKGESKKSGFGVEVTSYSFKNEDLGEGLVSQAINYIPTLKSQINPKKPESLFTFGDIDFMSYSALDSNIDLNPDSILDEETKKARQEIVAGYHFYTQLQQLKIPFYTFSRHRGSFNPVIREHMENASRVRDELDEYFDPEFTNPQYQCFEAGFEKEKCPEAARILKTKMPESQQRLLSLLRSLNYSVNLAGRNVSYPVNEHQVRKDGKTEQQLVSFDLTSRPPQPHGVIVEKELGVDSTIYDTVTSDEVRKVAYTEKFIPECVDKNYIKSGQATKTDTNVFIKTEDSSFQLKRGDKITFYDDFQFPYPSGYVCLHLPVGAAFAGRIHNKTTGEAHTVFEFKRKKVLASVGDEIEVNPLISTAGAKHTFKVTAPYDTEYDAGHKKLPLHTTVHLKGTVAETHFSLLYNDRDCF